jgi:hypothetical protein
MHAFEPGLDFEPTMPQGLPARWPITASPLIAAQLRDALDTLLHRHPGRLAPGLERHQLHHFPRQDLCSGSLGLLTDRRAPPPL